VKQGTKANVIHARIIDTISTRARACAPSPLPLRPARYGARNARPLFAPFAFAGPRLSRQRCTRDRKAHLVTFVCVNNSHHRYFDAAACIMDGRADRRRLLFRDRSAEDSRKPVDVEIISARATGTCARARSCVCVWWYSRRKLGHQTASSEYR